MDKVHKPVVSECYSCSPSWESSRFYMSKWSFLFTYNSIMTFKLKPLQTKRNVKIPVIAEPVCVLMLAALLSLLLRSGPVHITFLLFSGFRRLQKAETSVTTRRKLVVHPILHLSRSLNIVEEWSEVRWRATLGREVYSPSNRGRNKHVPGEYSGGRRIGLTTLPPSVSLLYKQYGILNISIAHHCLLRW
jgi:hypothetical protein